MFCESDQIYDGNKYNDDDEDEDEDEENSDSDRKEIELALYAQIHFHHEEDVKDDNLSCNGYSTTVQTVCPESTQVVHSREKTPSRSTLTQSGTATSPICLQSSPSTCTNITVSCEESMYFVSDDSDVTDSECMILDKTLSNIGDVMVHVDENQQPILQAAQTTTENDAWKISDQITGDNPTLPRYYNSIPVRCYNCKEMGHISNVCPKPKKSEICHLCGTTGHFFRKCPKGICYNCEGPGHNSYDCPKQRKQRGQTCFRCLMPGHSKNSCPDIWRQFHMTTSEGPVQKMEMKQNPKRFCSNCASRKHFGFECVEDRMERHENGNYPFISTYTHTDKSSARDKSSEIKLKKGKKTKHGNHGSNHWNYMATTGAKRGTKRKHRDDSEQHTLTGQGKHRKREKKFNKDEDPHVKSKSQKEKKKHRRTRWDNREETENYSQSGQGKQKKTHDKFHRGRKESVSKNTWQTYNPKYKKDKPYNSDKGFKTSYNTTNNYNKGF